MKTKCLILLVAGLLALTAWHVQGPNPVHSQAAEEKYREAARKGLAFLAKNQFPDGHWEGDGGRHPVTMTALAGLALVMENSGHQGRISRSPNEALHTPNVRKAADWLMAQSQADRGGLIFSGHASESARYMEGHGFATMFLAGAAMHESDRPRREKLIDVLGRAVKYIVKAQATQGGWHHTSKVEGHDFDSILATAIQLQALQAAENTGIPVPQGVINDAQNYLQKALASLEEKKSDRIGDKKTEIAAGLACRVMTRGERSVDETSKKWFRLCQDVIPMGRDLKFGRDELPHFYYAQAAHFVESNWSDYRSALFEHLHASQDADGGWAAAEGLGVGRVYATALACVILQIEKRSYPAQRVIEDIT